MQSESFSGSVHILHHYDLQIQLILLLLYVVISRISKNNEYPTTAVICGFPSSSQLVESNKSLVSTQSADKQVSSSTFNLAFVSLVSGFFHIN